VGLFALAGRRLPRAPARAPSPGAKPAWSRAPSPATQTGLGHGLHRLTRLLVSFLGLLLGLFKRGAGFLLDLLVGLLCLLARLLERRARPLLGLVVGVLRGHAALVGQLLRLLDGAIEQRLRRRGALEGLERVEHLLRRLRQADRDLAVLVLDLQRRQDHGDVLLAEAGEAAGSHHHAFDLVFAVEDQILDVAPHLAFGVVNLAAEQQVLGEILATPLRRQEDICRDRHRIGCRCDRPHRQGRRGCRQPQHASRHRTLPCVQRVYPPPMPGNANHVEARCGM